MTYLAVFLAGVLFTVAFNRTRWAIFPISGGPFGWMGGPPSGPSTTYATALADDELTAPLCDNPACDHCVALREGREPPVVLLPCEVCGKGVPKRFTLWACEDCCAAVDDEGDDAVDDPASLQ